MRLLLAILLTLPLTALAQFGAGVAAGGWEPLNIVTKAAIVACYDAGNASTITLNGTGVQQLRSRVVGVTNHLNQASVGQQPRYDTTNTVNGRATLYFDGTLHYIQTAPFLLAQPVEVWLGVNQLAWTSGRRILDGATNDTSILQLTSSPGIAMYAGSTLSLNTNLAVGSWGVLRSSFSGSSSIVEVNKTQALVGNAGASPAGGLTLGGTRTGGSLSNIRVFYGILCSKTNDTPEANFLRMCLMRRAGL